ncbi:MAG TPA: deaminase [Candidatus Paceibacterota bacterium]|nr:deaminase [Candidatus Paceibacterota bacterium]
MNGPVIASYVPALHRGYVDFFKRHGAGGSLFVVGSAFLKDVPRLERDIRALTPDEVREAVGALGIFEKTLILDERNLDELRGAAEIVMPDDEANRNFAGAHLAGARVTFVPVFLRWDRQISTKEFEVAPDRIVSEDAFDRDVIAGALDEAKKSPDWWRQVGAVLVRDRKPVLIAHNSPLPSDYTPNIFGDPRSNFDAGEAQYKDLGKFIHAEAQLIAIAAKKGIPLDGASLYVSTFPCPACAKSVAVAGIKEVFYAKGYSLLDAEDILKMFGVRIVMVK